MLIEQIDPIGLQALQRGLGDLANVCRPAVQSGLLAVLEPEPELRRDRDPVADRPERFADELLVREWPVHLGGVEESDPAVDSGTDDRDAVVAARRPSVAGADAHATEAQRRHLETASAQRSFLHEVGLLPAAELS